MKNHLLFLLPLILIHSTLQAQMRLVPSIYPTIQASIDSSLAGDTVLVSPGTYLENINFHGKSIVVTSLFYLANDTTFISSTIIDGSSPIHPDTASCVIFNSGEDSSSVLQGFTLTGGTGTKWTDIHGAGTFREGGGILIELSSPTIQHNLIKGNVATDITGVVSAGGGGMRVGDGNPTICNNAILQNQGRYGAGIVLNYTGATVKNNVIASNSGGQAYNGGSAIWILDNNGAIPKIIENNTIVNNSAAAATASGGVLCWGASNVVVRNNIIFANHSTQGVQLRVIGTAPMATYNDIQGGFTGVGNIDQAPMFEANGYLLAVGSPCIDAGDTSMMFNDMEDMLLPGNAQFPSMGSLRNDMGAYGGPCAGLLPLSPSVLLRNARQIDQKVSIYPNPNSGRFSLKTGGSWENAQIEVYNTLGAVVYSNAISMPSNQEIQMDLQLAKGVYLLKLHDDVHGIQERIVVQ